MYSQSIEEYKVGSQLSGERSDAEYASAMEQGFLSGGREGALRKGVEIMLAQRKAGGASAYSIATMYAELGEKDQAFRWLETSFQEHEQDLLGLKTDSSFDPIRSDPRFAELVRKVGLPPTPAADEILWPTKGWATASPASVGLDEQVLLRLDKDMASGKYSQMMDSFAVFRCGKKVFERTYPHDYAKIYAQGSRGTRAVQRAPYRAVQLFRSLLAPLLSRHGSAYDAIDQQDGHFGHHRRGNATRRLQSRTGHASIEILRPIESEKCGRPQAPHDLARPADHDVGSRLG